MVLLLHAVPACDPLKSLRW